MNLRALKSVIQRAAACGLAALAVGCSSTAEIYHEVTDQPRYQVHYDKLYATPVTDTRIEISISAQRAILTDADGDVLILTDVSTGMPGRDTPTGKFKILEKLPTKFSNVYGKYVDKVTGEVVAAKNKEEVGPQPPGTEYEGVEMPLWLRLTWGGVGMHVGQFKPGRPVSGGCIRVPRGAQKLIYEKTRVGTPVSITY